MGGRVVTPAQLLILGIDIIYVEIRAYKRLRFSARARFMEKSEEIVVMRIYQFKYVDRFRCDGSKCHAQCCCANWGINIDEAAYKRYHCINNQGVKNKILGSIVKSKNGRGYFIKLDEQGRCPLVCKDNLCYIQRNIGEDALSVICQTYPRKAIVLGECQLRSLSMTCPVAAKEALFSADGMVLEAIDHHRKRDKGFELLLRNLRKRKLQHTKAIDSVIVGGISIMQNVNFSREERMLLLGLFFDQLDDMSFGEDKDEEIIDMALVYQTEKFRAEAKEIMSGFAFGLTQYKQIMTELLSEMAKQQGVLGALQELQKQVDSYVTMHDKWAKVLEIQYGTVMDKLWVQEFLHHGYPFKFEGSFVHNYIVYILSYKMWEVILYGYIAQVNHMLNEDGFMLAINTYSKIMDHKQKYLSIINAKATELEKNLLKVMQLLDVN